MDDIGTLILALIALVAMSAFFSASETAYTSLNRARLKSMAHGGDRRAERALALSEDYDRLLSGILVGNNIVNILSASLATVLFVRLVGGAGVSLSPASCFSLGLNLKYAHQQLLQDYTLSAINADIFAQFHWKAFNLAAGIVGLGPKIWAATDKVKYSLPASVKLAADYVFSFDFLSLQLAMDADYYFSKNNWRQQ